MSRSGDATSLFRNVIRVAPSGPLQALANGARMAHGSAMSSDRLAQLELEARREAALQTVTAELSAAVTGQQILDAILDEGSRVLSSSAAVAYLSSQDGETLALVASRGISDALARRLDGGAQHA
jgi:hypothetical protein